VENLQNISAELQALDCKSIIGIKMPYTVPSSYFNNQLPIIVENAQLGIEKLSTPYQINDSYFSSLAASIIEAINKKENSFVHELEETAPTLASLKNKNVFTVPNNYFENTVQIPSETAAKIVSIKKWNIAKWIAAASMITIIAFGGLLFLQKPIENVNIPIALQKIEEEEMIQYLTTEHVALGNEVNILDDVENANKQKNVLENVTEEDLNNYLKNATEKSSSKIAG
jgi:hypothetical protein